jgi:hypothetical protein
MRSEDEPPARGALLSAGVGELAAAVLVALLGHRSLAQSPAQYISLSSYNITLKGLGHEIRIALKWYGLIGPG